jgi:hypothetical protein
MTQSKSDNNIALWLHGIAWIILIILPLYLNNVFGGGNFTRLLQFYTHTLSAATIFYVGYLWLIPRFYLREQKAGYFIILALLIASTYLVTYFINDILLFDPVMDAKIKEAFKNLEETRKFKPPFKFFGFINHVLTSILISGFAMGLGVMERLKQNEKRQKELEQEKLQSELAFLKNQVSPHFFFNTLNNIYSLIGIDGPTAQDSVLKLSKLMRYLLYESENGQTMMSHEIDFMNNYIDLMRLRLSSKVELKIDFPKEFPDFEIPPLLFVPFIENAFKHGVSYREQSFIHIGMKITDTVIRFTARNSNASVQNPDLRHSGIGLDNVRKRLGLLFSEKHKLEIENTPAYFNIELSIQKS